MALTRLQLRHETAAQLRDLYLGTATATGATSVTVPELVAVQNEWMGHELYVYAGTGIGQARTVTASGDLDGTFTVLAWTTQPTGASIEAHKRFTVDQYNRALNRAIRAARGAYVALTDTSLTQVSTTTEYTIPTGFIWLQSVESEATAGEADYFPLLWGEADGWSAVPGTLTIPAPFDGCKLRLRGLKRPSEMSSDSDTAPLDEAYLVEAACALLQASKMRAPALDRDAAAQTAALWQTLGQQQLRRDALQNAVLVGTED